MKNTSIVLAALLAAASATSAHADTYTDLLALSAKAMIAQNWRESLHHTRGMLDLPDLSTEQRAEGLNHLCIALTQIGRLDQAMRACDESVKLNPSDWGAYMNRGTARAAAGQRISAKADLRKAQELNPETDTIGIAESMKSETIYVLERPAYAKSEQVLVEQ